LKRHCSCRMNSGAGSSLLRLTVNTIEGFTPSGGRFARWRAVEPH
jgi:hypothetical protein